MITNGGNEVDLWLRRFQSVQKWSLAHDEGGRRWGMMTTNISEVYNNVLKGARGLPVTAILELTFYRTNEYFRDRRAKANEKLANGQMWVDDINTYIEAKREKANRHQVRAFDRGRGLYDVITPCRWSDGSRKGGRSHSVNLDKGTCTCGKATLFHYPCSHILAVCGDMAIDYNQFISRFYSVHELAQTWAPLFHPIPDVDYWDPYFGPKLIPNKKLKIDKPGRRTSRRIRNDMDEMEKSTEIRCGNCREVGHNVRKCPSRLAPLAPPQPTNG